MSDSSSAAEETNENGENKLTQFVESNNGIDYKVLRGILDSHHDFFKFKKSIDVVSYLRGDQDNKAYSHRYHFTSLVKSYHNSVLNDVIKTDLIKEFQLLRSRFSQETYTGGISSLEDDFVEVCERIQGISQDIVNLPADTLKNIDDLYNSFGLTNGDEELHVMVDTSKRVLKLNPSGKKLHYVLNSAIVNDPAPKLTPAKMNTKTITDTIVLNDQTNDTYTISGLSGPYNSVILGNIDQKDNNGKYYAATINFDNEKVYATMNRGSKHVNCISLLTKRMEQSRSHVSVSSYEIILDDNGNEHGHYKYIKTDPQLLSDLNYAQLLTRKRFGDELQAEICAHLNNSNPEKKLYAIVTIDRMLYAHCLLIGCPCILDMGKGKPYKIYKGNTNKENNVEINVGKGPPTSQSGGEGEAADDTSHHNIEDNELQLDFILNDPLAMKLYLQIQKHGRNNNPWNSANLISEPLLYKPTDESMPKEPKEFQPWSSDYYLLPPPPNQEAGITEKSEPSYSESNYHPYISDGTELTCGNNNSNIVYRKKQGNKYLDFNIQGLDVKNSDIIHALSNENQQRLIDQMETHLSAENIQSGGSSKPHSLHSMLKYLLCILHIYELNTIADHEIHAIDYFDNRDSFDLISDKLELRVFLTLLMQHYDKFIDVPSPSTLLHLFFHIMEHEITDSIANIILFDLCSHIDYVSDCGIQLKITEIDVTKKVGYNIHPVLIQFFDDLVTQTKGIIQSPECNKLIDNPYDPENNTFIDEYNLSFGGYSHMLHRNLSMPGNHSSLEQESVSTTNTFQAHEQGPSNISMADNHPFTKSLKRAWTNIVPNDLPNKRSHIQWVPGKSITQHTRRKNKRKIIEGKRPYYPTRKRNRNNKPNNAQQPSKRQKITTPNDQPMHTQKRKPSQISNNEGSNDNNMPVNTQNSYRNNNNNTNSRNKKTRHGNKNNNMSFNANNNNYPFPAWAAGGNKKQTHVSRRKKNRVKHNKNKTKNKKN
jgi:hypothetical protein